MRKGLRSKSVYAELLDRTNCMLLFPKHWKISSVCTTAVDKMTRQIKWQECCLLSRVSCHQASFLICSFLTPSYAIQQWAFKKNSNCHIKLLKGWNKTSHRTLRWFWTHKETTVWDKQMAEKYIDICWATRQHRNMWILLLRRSH